MRSDRRANKDGKWGRTLCEPGSDCFDPRSGPAPHLGTLELNRSDGKSGQIQSAMLAVAVVTIAVRYLTEVRTLVNTRFTTMPSDIQ